MLLGTPSIVAPDEWVGLRLGGSSHAPRDVVEELRRSGTFREVVGEREESSVNWDTGTDTRPLYAVDTTPQLLRRVSASRCCTAAATRPTTPATWWS